MPLAIDIGSVPDPHSAATAQEFVERMNDLRLWAGNPSLRMLRRLAGTTATASGDTVDALPESTTSYLLNGRGLPRPPRLEFVEAFVAACLSARSHPDDELAWELQRWRQAWRALAMETTAMETTVAETTTVPEVTAEETAAVPVSGSRWRRAVVIAGAAVLVVAATVLVYQGSGGGRAPETVAASATAQPAREVFRGKVPALLDTDGIDLDKGRVVGQVTTGVDVTPWGQGNHLVVKSGAMLAMLAAPGSESYERCAAVPAKSKVTMVKGLYDMSAPRNLCVWTQEGRVAMLTLDETPSTRTGTIALHYVVWEPVRA